MSLDGRPVPAAQPARRAARRRRDDLPGAVARAAPVRRREHPARHGARAVRPRELARSVRETHARRARAARTSATFPSTRRSPSCPSPRSSSSRSRRALAVGCRVLVLDEPTSSLARDDTRRLFALIGAAEARRPRHRLHLALHRRGQRSRRPHRRPARRPCRGDDLPPTLRHPRS